MAQGGYAILDNLNSTVGANLKRMRAERRMSLDGLAEITGVSKSMLGQIERGETSPTITTIWKIANGLKVSFSAFLERAEPVSQFVDFADVAPLVEDEGKYSIRPVFGVEGERNFEIFSLTMQPGGHLEAEPHLAGTQEFILVYAGALIVTVDGARQEVAAGQAFRFAADARHGYANESGGEMRCCMVLYYPK
jgi:transcriptional regulator with XRE-family HTH domain